MKLEDLKRLAAARTPGEWKYDWGNWSVESSDRRDICRVDDNTGAGHHDGEFIAAMANHVDRLLDVVEAAGHINDNLGYWFLDPMGPAALKEAFRTFEKALEALEGEK
jgi:hypothetical protein